MKTPDDNGAPKAGWTFLTNHAHVLVCIARDPHARIRDLAEQVGITERAVLRIIVELEQEGYLTHTHEGRRNSYRVSGHLPLRHPIERSSKVSALLALASEAPSEAYAEAPTIVAKEEEGGQESVAVAGPRDGSAERAAVHDGDGVEVEACGGRRHALGPKVTDAHEASLAEAHRGEIEAVAAGELGVARAEHRGGA